MASFTVRLSPLDTKRFNVVSAIAKNVDVGDLATVNQFCVENGVAFLTARVSSNNLACVQSMESDGFRLMDTLVYYAFKFGKRDVPDMGYGHQIRNAVTRDADSVAQIARDSFEGYFGHYHADSRLSRAQCDEVYVDWARRSVLFSEVADNVLVVYDESDELLAFATLRMNSSEEGEGVLFGVSPQAQGRGIYQAMMIKGMEWVRQQGAKHMVVSTQVNNIAVQKVWARLGFEMDRSYYTLHKWY